MFIPIKVILVASGEREGTWHNHTPDYKLKFNPMHVAHFSMFIGHSANNQFFNYMGCDAYGFILLAIEVSLDPESLNSSV